MAKEIFSFQERMMYEILKGKEIWIDGTKEVIDDIQFEPKTRQVIFSTVSGKSLTAFKDDEFEWEMGNTRTRIKPNKRMKNRR